MAFHDIGFLFLFFPAAILLYQFIPRPGKNILLLILSLIFFAWGSPEYLVLLVLSIVFNFFSGLLISHHKEQERPGAAKSVLISAVIANVLLLVFFKYSGFLLENVNKLLKTSIPVQNFSAPLGVSFFTFSILSFLYDIYRDKAPAQKNLLHFALYVSFFPKLVSGPIVSYQEFAPQLTERKTTPALFGAGCRLFLIGLAKKVLLANTLGTTFYAVTGLEQVSTVTAWLGAISYTLMLYFDFSGYSDMAIGLAQIFGFRFNKNFDHPYLADSITDFWRRWHISLGAWFRDYVYIPLGGSRVGTAKTIRNLFVVWLLTGIWHGASWNFIFWGLYYGVLQLLEKFVFRSLLEKLPRLFKIPFTLLLVIIGWVFFFSPDLASAFVWLGKMFGIGSTAFLDATGKYYLSGCALTLIISAFAAYPLGTRLGGLVYHKGRTATTLSTLWFALLLTLCIAGMLSSTYSSFLYFQF